MNSIDIFYTVRNGLYGDLDRFKSFLEAHEISVPLLVRAVIVSERIDTMNYVLKKFQYTTNWHEISLAAGTRSLQMMMLVCRHAEKEDLNYGLRTGLISNKIFLRVLLDNGADPNINSGAPLIYSAEKGWFDTLKTLHARGGQLTPAVFDAACYWDHYDIAYWVYLHGVCGFEDPGFLAYKARQDAIRNEAQRKIYFWILPKLMRNKEFIKRQANKAYDKLIEQQAEWSRCA